MRTRPYTTAPATQFNSAAARGVAARVVLGKADGADHFTMRVFEIAPDGHTPPAHPCLGT